jgi:uncharacterized membrane protein
VSSSTAHSLPTPARSRFQWIGDHWFETFLILYGVWVFTPFLAPVLMHVGWIQAGRAVYFIYSFFCHQLPERSFFLFGQKVMYSLPEIQAAWQNTSNPLILRQFLGNETMGWKMAWSDRMIWFYTSVWLFAVIWYPLRRTAKPLSWWGFCLLLMPMTIDGVTHLISDVAGIGQGFRDTNVWLMVLTRNAFPASFYAGDAVGSFNSLMRFATGVLAGSGIAWRVCPYIFPTDVYNQPRNEKRYSKIIQSIQTKDPCPPRR